VYPFGTSYTPRWDSQSLGTGLGSGNKKHIMTQIIVTITVMIVIQSTRVIILDKVQCMGPKACRLGIVV